MRARYYLFTVFLVLLTLANVIISLYIGPVHISIPAILENMFKFLARRDPNWTISTIIFYVRLPRIILAVLIGMILGISGLVTQTIFKNPLGDPYLTGVSSGAALGAAIGFLVSPFLVPFLAFFFAMLAVGISFLISRSGGEVRAEMLILAGVSVSFLFSAVASYLIYLKVYNLRGVLFWLLGGLYGATWTDDYYLFIALLVAMPVFLYMKRELDIMLMGDEQAKSLGVDTGRVKTVALLLSSLVTSLAVSFVGIIGFIGLVSPHIGRKIVGESHSILAIVAPLIGANLLLVSDTIARSSPQGEIPVGIITAFIGSPVLIYLLFRRRGM
ncbi:MAG: FecCD family ABC transporter permease [Thermoplasmata archaeon]